MTTTLNLIISFIILFLIITYKIIINKKSKNNYKGPLFNKIKKITLIFILLSLLIFIIALLFNLNNNIKTIIFNALSIGLLSYPIYLQTSYNSYFKDEEKLSHIKTIVTNIYDEKSIKKFNKEGINLIVLSSSIKKTKIKTISDTEISRKLLKNNLIIKTTNQKILDKIIDKKHTYYSFEELDNAYTLINNARGKNDNFIRTFKYLILTHLPLILSYLFLSVIGFPIEYNLLLTIIFKLFIILTSELVYKKMPYDVDITTRAPKEDEIIMGKQEMFFTIITSFIIFFVITIPYMLIISQGGSQAFANTLFFNTFIYSNIFITLSLISESNILKNLLKALTNFRLIIYILICIVITLIFNYTKYFNTRNIELHNFISCILFSLISILFLEVIKLARYTTIKGVKKNEHKNN